MSINPIWHPFLTMFHKCTMTLAKPVKQGLSTFDAIVIKQWQLFLGDLQSYKFCKPQFYSRTSHFQLTCRKTTWVEIVWQLLQNLVSFRAVWEPVSPHFPTTLPTVPENSAVEVSAWNPVQSAEQVRLHTGKPMMLAPKMQEKRQNSINTHNVYTWTQYNAVTRTL